MRLKTRVSIALWFALSLLATQSYAENQKPQDQTQGYNVQGKDLVVTFPPDTVLILAINAKNEPAFYDRRGEKLPECKLCTPEAIKEYKLNPDCEDADKHGINICPGTVGTNVRSFQSLTLYETQGSICFGGAIGGFRSGTCYPTPFYCRIINPSHQLCKWCQNRNNQNHRWCK